MVTIRRATVDDIPELVRLRRMMFVWMGYDDPSQLDTSDEAIRTYFAKNIPTEEFRGWLAITDAGLAVGSGGLVIDLHPPGPSNLSGKIGYIMNLSTDPSYRRQGIGRRILKTILEWLENTDISIATLHATEMGHSLYEELGFVDGHESDSPFEMIKELKKKVKL